MVLLSAPTTPIPENEVVDLTDHSRRKTKDSKEGSGEKKEGRRSLKNFLAMSRNISSSPIKDFLLGGAAMHKKASSFESNQDFSIVFKIISYRLC